MIDGVSRDAAHDLEFYNRDWMGKYHGHSKLVLKPENTLQVSKILKHCNDRMLAIVPQGGNTGLVGGSVPLFDEVILNLSRMNKIHSFDDVSGALVADAGAILEEADRYLADRHHIFPLDLGAKGSCHIGGNISTNAGGLRLMRYGSLHANVLGLEAVMADGTILDTLCTLRKNNTGYDFKHLFIGAEGTIGVITKAAVLCPQRPQSTNVIYLGAKTYERVCQAYTEAKRMLNEILSAFELMDSATQHIVRDVTIRSSPLSEEYPFYCLIETGGSDTEHDIAKVEAFLAYILEKGIVADGVLAQGERQVQTLWSWREGIPEALSHTGITYKYDVSIPIQHLYQIVLDLQQRLADLGLLGNDDSFPVRKVLGYGHMGDGNLHLNVLMRRKHEEVVDALEPWVFEWVRDHQGSISAEHGLGQAKRPFIGYSQNSTNINMMKKLKALYDPVCFFLLHNRAFMSFLANLICLRRMRF